MYLSPMNLIHKSEKVKTFDPDMKKKPLRKMSALFNRATVHATGTTSTAKVEKTDPGMIRSKSIPTNITVPAPIQKKKTKLSTLTPQQYLEALLRSRGYSVKYTDVLQTLYYNKPTPLQEASYGIYIVDVVRRNDSQTLKRLLSLGLSSNACNSYGESLVHLACRRGNFQSIQVLVDMKCNIQISDDYGRTPLHDLCWAAETSFQSAAILLDIDNSMLFMKDCRGASPLAYARQEHWADWIKFLESRKDVYWPKLSSENERNDPPTIVECNTREQLLDDAKDSLCTRLATLVASGKLTISEAEILKHSGNDGSNINIPKDTTRSDMDKDDISNSSFFDEDEMYEILGTIKDIMVHKST
jgi:ankyrin repeat protein